MPSTATSIDQEIGGGQNNRAAAENRDQQTGQCHDGRGQHDCAGNSIDSNRSRQPCAEAHPSPVFHTGKQSMVGVREHVNIHYGIDRSPPNCNKSFMPAGSDHHAIADRLGEIAADITPAEQKVARVLTTSAMLAGLRQSQHLPNAPASAGRRWFGSSRAWATAATPISNASSCARWRRAAPRRCRSIIAPRQGPAPFLSNRRAPFSASMSRDIQAAFDRRFRVCGFGAGRSAKSYLHHRGPFHAASRRDAASASLPDQAQCLDAIARAAVALRPIVRCRAASVARCL